MNDSTCTNSRSTSSATQCAAIIDILTTRGTADSEGSLTCEQLDARKETLRRIVSMLIKLVRRMDAE